MKITQRLVVLFLIVSLSFSVLIYLYFLIKRTEGRLYSQADALQRRQILNAFIDIKRNNIMQLIDEHSADKNLIRFTGNRSQSWAAANLPELISKQDLDIVQVYDSTGLLLFSSAADEYSELANFALPLEFFANLQHNKQVYFNESWKQKYIQIGAASIVAAADASVAAKPRGYLVIGKLWSVAYLRDFSETLDYNIRFFKSEPPLQAEEPHFNVNLTIPLAGWDGKPIAWLRFSSHNPFIEQWQSLGKQIMWGILAFTIIFLILQFAMLYFWMRAPLVQISNSLKHGNPELIIPLCKTKNEFGEIARLTARFFEQNQQLRGEVEERRKTEIMLRQSQKMESIGTLAGGIAHDFNNIITIISGYVSLASGKAAHLPAVKNNLQEAMQACTRAKDLIEKILTYSRQTEKNVQPVNVVYIINETIDLLKHTIPSSITIESDVRTDAFVLADPVEMQQVIMNISTNAYQSMRYEGGILSIELTELSGIETQLIIPEADSNRDYVKLTVRDTGVGISREILERVFDPYFSTKAAGEGTGLGLSIVHGIVTGNGGYINLNSIPGEGTVVDVFLPTTTLRIIEKEGPGIKPVFVPASLFFVDNEPALASLFRETLSDSGYSVQAFTDGVAALNQFAENPDNCDMLVADIAMPLINGIQLAQKFREIRPNLPIILYSGYSDSTIQKNCREIGINRLLLKPILSDALAKIIREVLAEQKPFLKLPV